MIEPSVPFPPREVNAASRPVASEAPSRRYELDAPLHADAPGGLPILGVALSRDGRDSGTHLPATPAATWDSVLSGLGFRPLAPTERNGGAAAGTLPTERPAKVDARPHLLVTICPEDIDRTLSPNPSADGAHVASDERGSVWKTPGGRRWLRPGYVLDVPKEGHSATLFLGTGALPGKTDTAEEDPSRSAIALAYGVRHALTVLLPRIGWIPLHAAAVELPGSTVLLVGPSGCGKSTLTMGLVQRGGALVSDDLVALSPPDPNGQVAAWSLTRGIRLLPDACDRFGLSGRPSPVFARDRGKRHVEANDAGPLPVARPSVLLAPTIVDRPASTFRALAPTEAFSLVAAQMLPPAFLSSSRAETQLRRTADLLRQCRPAELLAGRDLCRTPSALVDLLGGSLPL